MNTSPATLAVCTTIYPGVEPYLRDWYQSLQRQTDGDFQLWIALDNLDRGAVCRAIGAPVEAVWVEAAAGDSPAAIRQRVLAPIVAQCDGVVLVDSDDVLHPERVAAARAALAHCDLVACALRLVDQQGADLRQLFTLADAAAVNDVLPRHNVFGLSNTAWRCEALRRCLPIPADVEIVDWLLATRAWLLKATLRFDTVVGMDYRQHPSNMVRVRAPFFREQVLRDTRRAQLHLRRLCAAPPAGADASRLAALAAAARDIDGFADWVSAAPDRLEHYIVALNALDPPPLWWSSVAHPSLKQLWSNQG